jgi:PAS domain S-box-containing protein
VQGDFGYHHVALFTLDRQVSVLRMKARAGAFTELFPLEHRLELGQGLVGWAALRGQTGLANDVSMDSRYVNLYPELIPTRAELSVPIQVGGETVGVLDVQSPDLDAFGQNDVMVLETVADQIAVAIENARLYETARRELLERRRAEEELRESETRYRTLFEQANDAILVNNEDDDILDANQSACELWGYSREELLTMKVTDLQAPEVRGPRGGVIKGELAVHGGTPFESLDVHRSGSRIPVEVSTSRLADTQPALVLSIVRDIAERKRAEEALRSAEREKETILDSLVEHVLHQDTEMKILWANRAACESVGLQREELLGRYCYEIWPQQDTPCLDCPVLIAMETGLPAEVEKETPDGRAWFIRGYPEFGDQGEIVGGIEVTLEVTGRKQAEDALRLSEARYRGFVEQSYEGVWEIDRVGRTIFANARLAQILGYDKPEEMIGRRLADFAPKADPGFSLTRLRERRATNLEAQDCVLERADGSLVYAILSTLPHMDEAGDFDGATLFVTDITDRRQMEEALRQSEHRYRTLFESAGDAILIFDLEGRFLATNGLASQRLGYGQEEMLHMSVADIEPPEQAALLAERIEELRRYRHSVFETTHVRQDGTTIPVEVGTRLIEYEGKSACLGIVRDLTERRQMEQAMLRAERLSAMGHLAAALAHEINNPLQSIGNSMELALDFPLGEAEREEYLETVRQEINRLMALTTRVLDFARPPRLERRLTSVAETVQYALTLAGKQLAHSRIAIGRQLPEDLPPVLASHDQLAQVFLNLIINAIDAMPDGGKLDISARATAEQIEVSFTDSGPGIPADSLGKLFEPFHTTKQEGTGLGLAVSYSIIQQHGGTIQAGTAPDGGAVLTVFLPLAHTHHRHREETKT